MLIDSLANLTGNINMATEKAKSSCTSKPVSELIKKILQIMKDNRYIGDFKIIEDGKGNIVAINLIGAINKCGVIKPRFSVTVNDYEKFEKRYLPAKDFGLIIVSTSKGIMTHKEAKEKNIGGKLLAYVY